MDIPKYIPKEYIPRGFVFYAHEELELALSRLASNRSSLRRIGRKYFEGNMLVAVFYEDRVINPDEDDGGDYYEMYVQFSDWFFRSTYLELRTELIKICVRQAGPGQKYEAAADAGAYMQQLWNASGF